METPEPYPVASLQSWQKIAAATYGNDVNGALIITTIGQGRPQWPLHRIFRTK